VKSGAFVAARAWADAPEASRPDNGNTVTATAARRAARLDMGLSRAMTALASGAFRRFLAGGNAFVMRILEKSSPNIGVAGAAYVTANEAG